MSFPRPRSSTFNLQTKSISVLIQFLDEFGQPGVVARLSRIVPQPCRKATAQKCRLTRVSAVAPEEAQLRATKTHPNCVVLAQWLLLLQQE
jgi:hypothetical protein